MKSNHSRPVTHTRKTSRILFGSIAALLAAQSAQATDLYWDTNAATLNAGTTAGTWGTSNFWNSDPTGGGAGSFVTATTADDNLFFSAGTNTGANGLLNNITLAAAALAANKITFDDPLAAATNLTLSGATSLTLGGGAGTNSGIYVAYAASGGFANRIIISQALTIGSDVTFQNNSPSNTINFGGGVTGAFNVTLKNNSTRWSGISVQGGLNNGGTVTNSGTGSGDGEVYGVIGTNVTGVIQDSLTSVLSVSQNNTYTGQTTLKAGIMRMTGSGIAATGAGAFGNGGTIMFDGGIMQLCGNGAIVDPSVRFNVTSGKDYKIDLHIQGNNINSLRNMTLGTALAVNGGAANTNGLHKYGLATLTLTAVETYKGTTTIGGIESAGNQTFKGGTIQIGSGGATSTGSLDSASSMAFAGTGTINVTEASGVSQSLNTLTFTAGDGILQSTNNGGNSFLTFTTLAARGSSGIMNFLTTNGTNGTSNKRGKNR